MSLQIRKNGIDLVNYINASVFRSMESISGFFRFTYTVDNRGDLPIKEGDRVEIIADKETVLTGSVEGLKSAAASDKHDFVATGRDITGDIFDSTVGPIKEFTGSVQLIDICRSVLQGINLFNVGVVDETGLGVTGTPTPILPFNSFDITSSDTVESAFEFLERYARKRQVLLTTDGLENLILTRSTGIKLPLALRTGSGGNLKNASKRIDLTERFNSYTSLSQLNAIRMGIGTTPRQLVSQKGLATDGEIRPSRVFAFDAEESSDSFTAKDRAIWESNIRRARSLSYTGTVQGHSANNILWIPNRLIPVEDPFNRIKATLLIRSVRYESDLGAGSTTELDMTFQSAYTLQAEADQRDSLDGEIITSASI